MWSLFLCGAVSAKSSRPFPVLFLRTSTDTVREVAHVVLVSPQQGLCRSRVRRSNVAARSQALASVRSELAVGRVCTQSPCTFRRGVAFLLCVSISGMCVPNNNDGRAQNAVGLRPPGWRVVVGRRRATIRRLLSEQFSTWGILAGDSGLCAPAPTVIKCPPKRGG